MSGISKSSVFAILLLLLTSCWEDEPIPVFPVKNVTGYKPIYVSTEMFDVGTKLLPPQSLKKPGKIYTIAQYLFINEQGLGVHIYDNTNPAQPNAIGFLSIPGNTDIAVKKNILYANNLTDLIALDITDWNALQELSRFRQDYWSVALPPRNEAYFECVDNAKGVVIGWEETILQNPKCYR